MNVGDRHLPYCRRRQREEHEWVRNGEGGQGGQQQSGEQQLLSSLLKFHLEASKSPPDKTTRGAQLTLALVCLLGAFFIAGWLVVEGPPADDPPTAQASSSGGSQAGPGGADCKRARGAAIAGIASANFTPTQVRKAMDEARLLPT